MLRSFSAPLDLLEMWCKQPYRPIDTRQVIGSISFSHDHSLAPNLAWAYMEDQANNSTPHLCGIEPLMAGSASERASHHATVAPSLLVIIATWLFRAAAWNRAIAVVRTLVGGLGPDIFRLEGLTTNMEIIRAGAFLLWSYKCYIYLVRAIKMRILCKQKCTCIFF